MPQIDITEKWLLEVGGWKVMKEARSAYNAGAVLEATYGDGLLKGTLQSGGKELITGLHVRGRTDIENYCSCPDSRRRGIICRHAIAAGLHVALGPKRAQPGRGPRFGEDAGPGKAEHEVAEAQIPVLRVELSEFWLAALRKGKIAARVLVSKNSEREADSADRRLASWLQKHGLVALPEHLALSPALVPGFLEAAAGHREIVLPDGGILGVAEASTRLPATVEKEGTTFTIDLELGEATEIFAFGEAAARCCYLLSSDVMHLLPAPDFPASDPDFLRDLLDGWPVERDFTWVVAHLAALAESLHFPDGSAFDTFRLVPGDPRFRLTVEGSLNYLEARLFAAYGEVEVVAGEAGSAGIFPFEEQPGSGRFLVRNQPHEDRAMARLLDQFGFINKQDKLIIRGEQKILRFFSSGLPRIRRDWKVELGERIATILERYEPISLRLESVGARIPEGGWFGFALGHVTASGSRIPQTEIARLLRTGQPKVTLPGGRLGLVDLEAAEELEATLTEAGVERATAEGAGRVPADCLAFLATSVAELGGEVAGKLPESFAEPSVVDLEAALPVLFPLLRGYQVEGLAWMAARLSAAGGAEGGAVLADEMGLGKTVQTLAVLSYLAKTGSLEGPVLVVCPTSLLENWQREASRFVPDFGVFLYHGAARDAAGIEAVDLVITSYGIVAREGEEIGARRWGAVVLDEASLIRNPDARVTKAVHSLDAGCRLALTGTPIENRPSDLWSLMRFVRPGYLGDRKDFVERFEKPLSGPASNSAAGENRGQVAARLRRKIAPFVLRRLKSRVAGELPPKIERVLPIDLSGREREVYRRILQEGLNKANDERKKGGQGAARMCLLTTLLRLRQTCCDLRLLGLEEEGVPPSSKFEALKDLLMEAIEGGHRCLVFSQFAKVLQLLRKDLKAGGMPCSYLDGSSRDRAEQVERFQNTPEIPVFLISLKAGGYGLNLTAADTVIHYDPWWNPAVEAQATDRAHRIGQERSVDVYKLIATGTVEESIIRLQQRKRDILDVALDDEAPLMSGLGDEELQALLGT